jgi:hypothetical protein
MHKMLVQELAPPDLIQITDGLPIQNKAVFRMPAKDFATRHRFTWDENIYADHDVVVKEFALFFEPIKYRIAGAYSKLILANMSSKLGYGVFAYSDISAGTYLGCYSGIIRNINSANLSMSQYVFSLNMRNKSYVVDAQPCGNITRFLQDLPDEGDLTEYYFDNADTRKNVALANVAQAREIINLDQNYTLELIKLVAKRDIKKNEILGFSYGNEYWHHNYVQRLFFNKHGETISSDKYQPLSVIIHADGVKGNFRCSLDICLEVLQKKELTATVKRFGWPGTEYYPFLSGICGFLYRQGYDEYIPSSNLEVEARLTEYFQAVRAMKTIDECFSVLDEEINTLVLNLREGAQTRVLSWLTRRLQEIFERMGFLYENPGYCSMTGANYQSAATCYFEAYQYAVMNKNEVKAEELLQRAQQLKSRVAPGCQIL